MRKKRTMRKQTKRTTRTKKKGLQVPRREEITTAARTLPGTYSNPASLGAVTFTICAVENGGVAGSGGAKGIKEVVVYLTPGDYEAKLKKGMEKINQTQVIKPKRAWQCIKDYFKRTWGRS